jgi:hypothetical protein
MTTEQATIEQTIEQDKAIALFMGVNPEIEYYIGNDEVSVFHPKHCGYDWAPRQKAECERWLSERGAEVWVKKGGYQIKSQEWWPFYHQDWNKLMPVVKVIRTMNVLSLPGGAGGWIKAASKMNSALLTIDLQKAHEGVYEFIQWYNTQTNNDGK